MKKRAMVLTQLNGLSIKADYLPEAAFTPFGKCRVLTFI